MKRYAIVSNARDRQEAEAYLPDNYRVIYEEKAEDELRPRFVIAGEDVAGWTLDAYVTPRYHSGLIWTTEVDLSHPIFKRIEVRA